MDLCRPRAAADPHHLLRGPALSDRRDAAAQPAPLEYLSKNKPFIGLDNFRELIGDPLFLEALLNTTIIAFGVLIITIPTALFLAALIYHRTQSRLAGFYETAVFLPHVVSLVPARDGLEVDF